MSTLATATYASVYDAAQTTLRLLREQASVSGTIASTLSTLDPVCGSMFRGQAIQRVTNFVVAVHPINIPRDLTAEGNFPTEATVSLARELSNYDVLMSLALDFDMAALDKDSFAADTKVRFAWVRNAGHAAISSCELLSDSKVIDRLDPHVLNLLSQYGTRGAGIDDGELRSDFEQYEDPLAGHDQHDIAAVPALFSNVNHHFIVDLPFFFTNSLESALPLSYIRTKDSSGQALELRLKLNPWRSLVRALYHNTPFPTSPYFYLTPEEMLDDITLLTTRTGAGVVGQLGGGELRNLRLLAQCVMLGEEERARRREYMEKLPPGAVAHRGVYQFYQLRSKQKVDNTAETVQIDLNDRHPLIDAYVMYRRANATENYFDTTLMLDMAPPRDYFDYSIALPDSLKQAKFLTSNLPVNPLSRLTMYADNSGRPLVDGPAEQFGKYDSVKGRRNRTPRSHIHAVSFATRPAELEHPTGHLNRGGISQDPSTIRLNVALNQTVAVPGWLFVYERCWNSFHITKNGSIVVGAELSPITVLGL